MSSLFHPSLLSNSIGRSFEPTSPLNPRTKEAGQIKNSPAVRENVRMFFAQVRPKGAKFTKRFSGRTKGTRR